MIRTLESQLLAMPAPMRSLLLQQTATKPLYLSRRFLSSTTTTLYPRSRVVLKSPSLTHPAAPAPPEPSPTPPQPAVPPPASQPIPPPSVSRPSPPPSPSSPPLSFTPPPSNSPLPPIPSPPVPPSLLTTATEILTTPPPRFLYSAPRFLNLPLNLRCPEICLLGRSNVGKSTLINALAGIPSSLAGRSHGSSVSNAKKSSSVAPKAGLAITSSRAGCTKTLNGYAFGLPTKSQLLQQHSPDKKDAGGYKGTRSERRDLAHKTRDTTPHAAMVLMDMPGYGLNSRSEWGVEISKYLSRRKALRGAVLLIDAVAGPKDGDRLVLRLLRDANVRTTVVLTKADKLGYGKGTRGEEEVRRMCEKVWELLRALEEKGDGEWKEGSGWDREIWVTGAGDPRNGGLGVEGARFAIARMAGLVEDTREEAVGEVVRQAPAQRIVPFEELRWRTTGAGGSGRFEVAA